MTSTEQALFDELVANTHGAVSWCSLRSDGRSPHVHSHRTAGIWPVVAVSRVRRQASWPGIATRKRPEFKPFPAGSREATRGGEIVPAGSELGYSGTMRRYSSCALGLALVVTWAAEARARELSADSSNYRSIVSTLVAGDTLHLAAGDYALLGIRNLNGTPSAWITIAGPASGAPATFHADPGPCCNTVEIADSSYVALQNVTIDGGHVDGAFGISAQSGVVHDITIEGCTLVNHDGSQQHDAISTKVPTWGWTIRKNRIENAGTGLYLGNSDGSDPFVAGVIEDNLVVNPIGYCMEIKFQNPRPSVAGMPTGPSSTLIRNNVFIKGDGPSPDGDRPNVLVGGFPDSGPGSEDRYEIYGNLFVHNPRESLLQVSGRVTIHDNVFVDSAQNAITLQDHDLPLKLAYVYDNTIYGTSSGIRFGNSAPQGDGVVANLIFAGTPIAGPIADSRDNLTLAVSDAPSYVTAPSLVLGQMDFYPLAGKCEGAPSDPSKFANDIDYDRDFNGTSRGTFTFRGAYAGSGKNPGWPLGSGIKALSAQPDAGPGGAGGAAGSTGGVNDAGRSDSGGRSGAGGAGASANAGQAGTAAPDAGAMNGSGGVPAGTDGGSSAASPAGDSGGCGCRSTRGAPGSGPRVTGAALALLGLFVRGLRRRFQRRDT